MLVYIIRRFGQSVFAIAVMAILVFVGVFVIGNPVDILISPDATQADMEAAVIRLGLDKPLWQQFFHYAGGVLRGQYLETDFASFIAWRDWDFPDATVKNCFALGALRGSDGAFLLGVMGPHTMNAGRIYFPGGTPDPSDIAEGKVDLEGSVRRLLDRLGLPFEPVCVEFHKTARPVHTASSEQVRRPINREGLEQWRHYEPWLAPLRTEIGDTLEFSRKTNVNH